MQLTAYIASANDGYFLVKAKEVPELLARTSSLNDIPDAVREAAARLTGRAAGDFEVIPEY